MELGIIIRGKCSPETETHIRESLTGAANTITANLKKLNIAGVEILIYPAKGEQWTGKN